MSDRLKLPRTLLGWLGAPRRKKWLNELHSVDTQDAVSWFEIDPQQAALIIARARAFKPR